MRTKQTRVTSETVVGGVAGLAIGYVLWLIAISIGDDLTTVSRWSLMVLMASGVLGLCAAVGGWWLRWRGKHLWAAVAVGLPVLPVVLTLAVLVDIYF